MNLPAKPIGIVLSRRPSEAVIIAPTDSDERATVTVTEIRGDKVRLCIDAPKGWSVHRQEVADTAIQQERLQRAWSQCPAEVQERFLLDIRRSELGSRGAVRADDLLSLWKHAPQEVKQAFAMASGLLTQLHRAVEQEAIQLQQLGLASVQRRGNGLVIEVRKPTAGDVAPQAAPERESSG